MNGETVDSLMEYPRNTHRVVKVEIPWLGGSTVRTMYKVVDNLGVMMALSPTFVEAERVAEALSEPPPDE